MFDIWETISLLRQPCLSRAATGPAVSDEGLVKDTIFRSIDDLLWEDVETAMCERRAERFDETLYTDDKWLTTSALQKCIRRGHRDLAERYARSGVRMDANHTFRRLAIIALEDVGLGDLRLVAASLAILGDKRRRQRLGEERLAVYLATELSSAMKSRLSCEMLSLVEYDIETAKIAEPIASLQPTALSEIFVSEDAGSSRQIIALWMLLGTDQLRSQRLSPKPGAGRRGLLNLLTQQSAPLIFHYIVRMGLSRCRDTLAIPYVCLALLAARHPFWQVIRSDIPEVELIGSYPSFAYDMHTWIGRRALKQFEVNCSEFLKAGGVQDVGNFIFSIEGGALNARVMTTSSDRIRRKATQLELFGREGPCIELDQVSDDLLYQLDTIRRRAAVNA